METELLIILFLGIAGHSSGWKVSSYWPSDDIVDNELVKVINGSVMRPGHPMFYRASVMKNTDFNSRPGAIAFVRNAGTVFTSGSVFCDLCLLVRSK